MKKVFEDYFSELQTDMVAICLEYVEHLADEIYIYGSYEDAYFFNVFYNINGNIVLINQINEVLKEHNGQPIEIYNPSSRSHWIMLKAGTEYLKEIHKKCKEFNRDMPTEIKLHYNVKENNLRGKYRYDLIYSLDETLLPEDLFLSWFEEVKKEIENRND